MVIIALDHVPHCYSTTDGLVIAKLLRVHLDAGCPVALSLAGVSDIPTSFANAAFVSLLDDFRPDWLRAHLSIIDASHQASTVIKRCLQGAIERLQAA
jgi:Na+-transporting methylmalonyl-CoA/oxaloacetate decarboxylase beta subunit